MGHKNVVVYISITLDNLERFFITSISLYNRVRRLHETVVKFPKLLYNYMRTYRLWYKNKKKTTLCLRYIKNGQSAFD